MADLFRKRWRIQVDTMVTDAHDCAFQGAKTIKRTPNTCSLKIWNLSDDFRQHIESLSVKKKAGRGKIRVQIEAGLGDDLALLFRGDLRTAVTERQEADLITTVEGDDGGRDVLLARVSRSFPPGTPVLTVVRALAQALGVGEGNLAGLQYATRAGATFPNGTVLSGKADEELTRVLHSCGLTWSIQNGVLQLLQAGKALANTAVVLRAQVGKELTGLVGTPCVNPDGTVTATCFIVPGVFPGSQVMIDCPTLRGRFMVKELEFDGDTAGDPWYFNLLLKPVT